MNVNGVFSGTSETLASAITNNRLINDKNSPKSITDPATKSDPGHKASEIWIATKENGNRIEMRLTDVFSSARNLCGDSSVVPPYTNAPNPSMTASEVELSNGGSLQESINAGEVLYTKHNSFSCATSPDTSLDVYYFDSCNRQEEMKGTDCTVQYPSRTDYSAWSCPGGNQAQRTATNHQGTCSGDSCTDSITSQTTQTEDCNIVPACDTWGNWYCKTSTKAERTRFCYTGSCSVNTGCQDNRYSTYETDNCGGSTSCSGGDCYLNWDSRVSGGYQSCPTTGFTDSCNGNRASGYLCLSTDNKNCNDIKDYSCALVGGTGTYTVSYKTRAVRCHAP